MQATTSVRALLAVCGVSGFAAAASAQSPIWDVDALSDGNVLATGGWDPNSLEPNYVCPLGLSWTGEIVWSVADSVQCDAHSAQRLANGNTLIADTGNSRIIEVDAAGEIVWADEWLEYLSSPTDAKRLADGSTLIVDSGNHRVLVVNAAGTITWQFGTTGTAGFGTKLRSPQKAERLANGNTLIADTGNNRVIEVNAARQIVRSFAFGLRSPNSAQRLANGNTLIADTGNHRVAEFTAAGQLVRTIAIADPVYDAERLVSGNTLASGDGWIREYSPQGQLLRQITIGGVVVD